jgi:multiple sugar transport system ATP-binding protein
MGNEMIVYLEEGNKNFIGRLDPRTQARVGNRMNVVINVDNIHLFDAQTEESLVYTQKQQELNALA